MQRISMLSVTASLLLLGCSSDDGGTAPSASGGAAGLQGGMPGGGNAGSGGFVGTTGGSPSNGGAAGSGGDNTNPPLRPPNPRTDIGPPDGVTCRDNNGRTAPCGVGTQCCPADINPSHQIECVAPGAECTNCTIGDCGRILCDGPEDCPGKLCCLRAGSCTGSSCPRHTYLTACEDRCEGDGTVVCKDARDCLYPGNTCNTTLNPFVAHCY